MGEHNKSSQARKGLVDSVKGKVKEVAGAVTGNDSLTAEGQLEQTQAHERKEANAVEAVADSQSQAARQEELEAKLEGAQQRSSAAAQAAAAENTAEAQKAAQQHAADRVAQQSAAMQQSQAEADAQRRVQQAKAEEQEEILDTTDDVVDAAAEHRSDAQVAAHEKAEAERLRRIADNVTNDADLS
jgi:uncharacterized protein YjbJ (UPF0337 family)